MASKRSVRKSLSSRFGRKPASRVVYLFREGETERQYLQDLSDGCGIHVTPVLSVADPLDLINGAVAFLNANADDFRRNSALEIWIVFDDDEKPSVPVAMKAFPATLRRIKNANLRSRIHVGFMKPCIELWAVMCLPGGLRAFGKANGHRKMESLLRRLMPTYRHDGNPYFDVSKMTEWREACKRAQDWERQWGPFPDCVPATWYAGIHELVTRIQTAKGLS